jgi:hypothetical protein
MYWLISVWILCFLLLRLRVLRFHRVMWNHRHRSVWWLVDGTRFTARAGMNQAFVVEFTVGWMSCLAR